MKCVVNDQVVLSREPEGPLAAHIGAFAKSRSAQGYAPDSIHRQVLLAACFSRWLKQKGVRLRYVSSDHPSRYLRYRARRVRSYPGDAAALRHLIEFLRREGVIARREDINMSTDPGGALRASVRAAPVRSARPRQSNDCHLRAVHS